MKFSPAFFAFGALLLASSTEAVGMSGPNNPAESPPTITNVVPNIATAGSRELDIVVKGTNLELGTQVNWNGTALKTYWGLGKKLMAVVPAADIAIGGTASITLSNAVGVSSGVTFTVLNPRPGVTRTSPATLTVGTLTVQGNRFAPSSVILINGTAMATTFVNATTLTTSVPPSVIVGGQSANIRVFSPTPGGGSSNVLKVAEVDPLPVLTGVSPSSFTVGQSGGTLSVTGQDFVSGAKVYWGSQALNTSYQSATSLSAVVPTNLLAALSTASISVKNPAPGGGSSGGFTVSVGNPVPVLSTVWPPAFAVYEQDTGLTLTGSGFVPGATVYWNGAALTTQYISQYSVTATVPAGFFTSTSPGAIAVTVGNPSPGGGMSNALSVTETCYAPAPFSSSLDITDDAADQSVQVAIFGVVPAASLSAQWNGSPLTIQSVSSDTYNTTVTILVPAADIEAGGPDQIKVVDGCGSSGPITVDIAIPTPTLISASPDGGFGIVGGSGITATLTGTNFLPGITVSVDGIARTTTYISGTEVTIPLTAADVGAVGAHVLTATNTGAGAKSSFPYFYTIGYSVKSLSENAFDLTWDATNRVLYASVGYWATNADTLLTIDPTSGSITNTLSTSSPPDVLAISDDDSYLYVGFGLADEDTAVLPTIKRYSLPGLVPDISWTVGAENNFAEAIAVAPGAPHTLAVVRDLTGDVLVYDDGVARPNTVARLFLNSSISFYEDIAWSADATTLYSGDYAYSYSLYKFDVNSSGVTFDTKYNGILPNNLNISGIHFDALTGYVFTDSGIVIDPASGTVVKTLSTPVTSQRAEGVVLDDAAGELYVAFPGGSPTYGEISIVSYDLATLTATNTAVVFTNYPTGTIHLTRWGDHGLALIDGSHSIEILQGDFVK